jgi:hypothetical protein
VPAPLDALVTHIEVNERHGVGVLLQAIFGGGDGLTVIRSRDDFGGAQPFGERTFRIDHRRSWRWLSRRRVGRATVGLRVKRILCVPYFTADLMNALALHELHDAPICTWLMDDQTLEPRHIPAPLMAELLQRSRLRLAISPELRDAYVERFGVRFGVVPPLVSARLTGVALAVVPVPSTRGLVVGNIWGQSWYQDLRRAVREAGLQLDWCSPAGLHSYWEGLDPAALAADGIHPLGALTEAALVERLRAAPFILVPTGTLDERDDHRHLTRFSLPSRITFAIAAAQVPVIVLGSGESAAARFVTSAGVGLSAPHDGMALRRAVETVTSVEGSKCFRARAAELGPGFTAEGAAAWLWESLAAGRPIDERYERLARPRSP